MRFHAKWVAAILKRGREIKNSILTKLFLGHNPEQLSMPFLWGLNASFYVSNHFFWLTHIFCKANYTFYYQQNQKNELFSLPIWRHKHTFWHSIFTPCAPCIVASVTRSLTQGGKTLLKGAHWPTRELTGHRRRATRWWMRMSWRSRLTKKRKHPEKQQTTENWKNTKYQNVS